ncbi:MAG: hypothetical protein FJ121_10500 [Deltaproteobacteria bacterium]|nr:hypothetical protein [Deltaproteobacteria bacterium]
MKLLSVKQARAIWLIQLVDLNPRGLNLVALIPPITKKYKFQQFPIQPEELGFGKEIKEIKFSGGSFQKDAQHDISIDLTLYNDGLVVDTRSSTEDSDSFLNEFLNWISMEFDLVPYQEVLRSKLYHSELWVKTDKSLNTLNPKLENFAKRLTSLIVGHNHHPILFETYGISFWTNPTITLPPGPFKFERAEGVPFNENRYYSAAPLQTDVHIEMLEELENILSR